RCGGGAGELEYYRGGVGSVSCFRCGGSEVIGSMGGTAMENWRQRLSVDSQVCHGRVCIKGTRVMASVVLANLADGETIEEIMRMYHLQREDVMAAIGYAAELANERIVVASSPGDI